MNKTLYLPIFFLILSGCRATNASSMNSSPVSSIPIPNEDFNPSINGRTILRETIIQTSYQSVELSPLNELPLSEFNFPTIENVVTPYAVVDAVESNFENQVITFSNQTPNIPSNLSTLSFNQSIEDQAAMMVLENLQVSDERFNQTQFTRKHRDLSHVYFGSDYYWFNNFVEEEDVTLTRYPNFVTHGQWQMNKTFQTEIMIPVGVAYQLYADANTIYEIRDETYPSGFFGAQDQKFETIRTLDNFKHALMMGPMTTLLQQWRAIERNESPFGFSFFGDILLTNRSLSIRKTGEGVYTFKFQVYLGSTFETADENYQMVATLRGNTWEGVEQHYQLWQPTSITS